MTMPVLVPQFPFWWVKIRIVLSIWALNHKSSLLNGKPDCPLVKLTTYDTETSPSVLLKLSVHLKSSPKLSRLIFYKFSCQLGQILTSLSSCLKISKRSFCRHI